ncbi:MAG: DUF1211 domain-containing protein [Xanthomonadales bacterium]|nr:DUF1211 domain-containing protein [Xanthomonadales bacterium]
MNPLSPQFVDSCPVERGFRMRGEAMTRIEVFVDAAFAFAVTMLMISFDHIPGNFQEMVEAIKTIPAFILAATQLIWIWYEHSKWSKLYGLEDVPTVVLSAALLIVILVYIYPLRIMLSGMMGWMSNGYFPYAFTMRSYDDMTGMFVFMGIGFTALSLVFYLMYRYARKLASSLLLSNFELHETRTVELIWLGIASTGLLAVVLALILPDGYIQFSGFAFMLIAAWIPWIRVRKGREMERAGIRPHESRS